MSVLERLDTAIKETDERVRLPRFGYNQEAADMRALLVDAAKEIRNLQLLAAVRPARDWKK